MLSLVILPGACRRKTAGPPADRPVADRALATDGAAPLATRPDAAAPAPPVAAYRTTTILPPAGPGDTGGVVLVVSESFEGKAIRRRLTAVRLLPDGRLVGGRVLEEPEPPAVKAGSADPDSEWNGPSYTHDDRYLYQIDRVAGGSCVVHRLALFGPDRVTLPVPGRCPDKIQALDGRILISSREPDTKKAGGEVDEGKTKLGELLPPEAATRVEWFHTSRLTKPNDFLVRTDRTLVAVDNTVYPKYALVYDWLAQGRPRYRYAATLEDSGSFGPHYRAAATTDDALFILVGVGNSMKPNVLVYAITPKGLVPRAMVAGEERPFPVSDEDYEAATWGGGLAILGERLVMGAGFKGLAHVPVTVQGGWKYETSQGQHGFEGGEGPTVGSLCDDAGGKWGCRKVDLRKAHPAAVGRAPRFQLLSLGGGACLDLVVRQGRAHVLARPGPDKRELVVVAWDPTAKALKIERRVPLPVPSNGLVH
jgi:hypothetical protein